MRLFRFLRRHPLALMGVIAAAFIGWIWWDAIPTSAPTEPEIHVLQDANGPIRRRILPQPPELMVQAPVGPDATIGLTKLKPGMTRAEVEKLVGAPVADHVYPATVADGRVTYQAAYEADFGPPQTVRPIHGTHRVAPSRVPEPPPLRTLVTLEFDATKPGHPLLDIHYPDPLF